MSTLHTAKLVLINLDLSKLYSSNFHNPTRLSEALWKLRNNYGFTERCIKIDDNDDRMVPGKSCEWKLRAHYLLLVMHI